MDWVQRLAVVFLLLNPLQYPVCAVGRDLKKKKKGSAAYSYESRSSFGIAGQKRKGKKFADDSLGDDAIQEISSSEPKGKKGGKAGKEGTSCKSGTKKKKKKKKTKKTELLNDDEEECIEEPTMLPTVAPTALPTLTPTARPSTMVPTSSSTLSLKSKKSKKKSKKEKSKKTSKKGSQSDVATDNREIVGWFSSIEGVSPSPTAEDPFPSADRPTDNEKQPQESVELSTAPPSTSPTTAPVPQERTGPKPAPISSPPVLLEPSFVSAQPNFRHPPELYLEMPRASLSPTPAPLSSAPAIDEGEATATSLEPQLSQEDMTTTPVSYIPWVANSLTLLPEPSHRPSPHNIADNTATSRIRVGVPSFHVTYSLSNAYPSPSSEQLNQVAELTISYIDDYFENTFSMVDVTVYENLLGARGHVGTDGTMMEFLLAAEFLSSSQYIPSSTDLLILLQTAFAQPAAQTFIIMLSNLPLNNPFNLVDKVSISSGSVPYLEHPGMQSSKSDESHHVLTGAVFTTFAIAGFLAVYRWKLSSSKKSERSTKRSRTRLDSDPGSITELSLYSYSGIDKEEETGIQFDCSEPLSPASSVKDEALFTSNTDATELHVKTPLPTIQEDDGQLLSVDEEAIETNVFRTTSPEEDDSVSSCDEDDRAIADGSKTADSQPDSGSSSDDVSFGSSTEGSLFFEDDDSTNLWDTV